MVLTADLTDFNRLKQLIRGLSGTSWLLLWPFALCAQPATLTGTVVDTGTGKPIPFATIELPARHLGVQATEAGTFVLSLPAAPNPTDSLRVASLGFAPRMLALPKTTSCRLELTALAVPLTEVVVRPSNAQPVRLGPEEDGDKYGFGNGKLQGEGNTGWQVARKFTDSPTGLIQSVRFYLTDNKLYGSCGEDGIRAPFRVRVYAADGENGTPGTDLLIESVVTTAAKVGWHEVDLNKFQLRTPKEGFFVAMEWLYTDAVFSCERTFTIKATNEKRVSYCYGQILGGYKNDTPKSTWNLKTGKPWSIFSITFPNKRMKEGNQNAAIQAMVQPD